MYLEYFKTKIDKKRALSNAAELTRALTALVPSIALVEIIIRFREYGVVVFMYTYQRTEPTEIQRMLLSKVGFGKFDRMDRILATEYNVIVKRRSGDTRLTELYVMCDGYPWFAPPELETVYAEPVEDHDILSIRVPNLVAGERLIQTRGGLSKPIPDNPCVSTEYVGQDFGGA